MGRKNCKGCDQFDHNWKSLCNYSCRDKQILRLRDNYVVDRFVKELYEASGIYISPNNIYKYKKIIEEFL